MAHEPLLGVAMSIELAGSSQSGFSRPSLQGEMVEKSYPVLVAHSKDMPLRWSLRTSLPRFGRVICRSPVACVVRLLPRRMRKGDIDAVSGAVGVVPVGDIDVARGQVADDGVQV